MAKHISHSSLKLLCILILILVCAFACAPAYVPPQDASAPTPEKVMITDIGKESEGQKTSIIVYSNQMINYTSFAQQDPPALVLDIPDVYLHRNLMPMEFSEGPVKMVIPEQILSEESVQTRLTIKMAEAFPYEINREKNQLRINIKEYTIVSQPLANDESSKTVIPEEKSPEDKAPEIVKSKQPVAPKFTMPERKIIRTISKTEKEIKTVPPQEARTKPIAKETSKKESSINKKDEISSLLSEKKYTGKPISLDFQNADIRSVLRIIADVSGRNLVIDPEVKGRVDITLIKPVPWDHALDVILKTNKLSMKMEGNIIRVGLPQTFASEKDAELKEIQAARKAREEATKVLPLETRIITINYAKAEVLLQKVQPMLSKSGELAESPSIMVDERTNTLIIKDLPESIDEIVAVINTLDRPTPQVMIEARIVETNKNFAKDLGIQWGGTYSRQTNYRFANTVEVKGATGGQTGLGSLGPTGRSDQYAVNLPIASSAFGAIGINLGHVNGTTALDLQLKAMETSGKGRIISNPRIATLDNEQATIKSGHKIPYQTTDAEGNPSTSFVDAVINLTVTPQITPDNNITMKIQADKSEPDWSRTVAGAPSIITRNATTRLIVANGDTAVIGGLAQHNEQSNERKVPFFGDIPILRYLFKANDRTDGFDELLIFITPRIIKDNTMKKAELGE
ncbi:MAG: type IV pilus secretin PilQ [bacterium]